MGLTREEAARFGFLLALPIILGSGIKKVLELGALDTFGTLSAPLLVGAAAAFIVGIASIHFLLRYLKQHTLLVFVAYRVALAALVLLWF